jgi:hypothetical protein
MLTLAVAAAPLLLGGTALAQKPAEPPQTDAPAPPVDAPAPDTAVTQTPSAAPGEQPEAAPGATEATEQPGSPAPRPASSKTPASEETKPAAGLNAAPAPAAPAPQNTLDAEQRPPGPGEPLGSYQRHLEVIIGLRTSFVADGDYRLFARTVDRLAKTYPTAQLTLGAGGTVWARQRLSLLVVGFWDYGGSSSALRGEQTDLDVHRLTLGAELRHHYFPWLYSMARLAPAAIDVRASLDDTASTTLYRRKWSFGFDASVGAGAQVFGPPSAMSQEVRGWGAAELGYGWANPVDLTFRAEDGAPQRMQDVSLGKLAIRGPMFRLSAGLTFF